MSVISKSGVKVVIVRGAETGREWSLTDGRYGIGRDENCRIRLTGDVAVSLQHAEVLVSGGRVELIDQSTNGTFVNQRKIKKTILQSGDKITLGGSYELLVSWGAKAASEVGEEKTGASMPPVKERPRGTVSNTVASLVLALVLLVSGIAAYFLFLKDSSETSLLSIADVRNEVAADKDLSRLLELAHAHERRGDYASAFQVYNALWNAVHDTAPDSKLAQYAQRKTAALAPYR